MSQRPVQSALIRRRLLLGAVSAWSYAQPIAAAALQGPRELWITRPEAQESARAIYWADGTLQAEGYRIINRLYRDLHADVERPIDVRLLDLNFALQCAVARSGSGRGPPRSRPLILLSGFRTPATNRSVGGAEPSAHEAGEADDFIYEGLSLEDNFRLAQHFQVGGLGVYPDRGSLHKDLGALRTWIQYGRGPPAPAPIRINPERQLAWRQR